MTAAKISELKIQDNWLVYIARGLSEAQSIGEQYRVWKKARVEEIAKGVYVDRIDVLLHNKMPMIDLKAAMDEFESQSESDPAEW